MINWFTKNISLEQPTVLQTSAPVGVLHCDPYGVSRNSSLTVGSGADRSNCDEFTKKSSCKLESTLSVCLLAFEIIHRRGHIRYSLRHP